jgi:hypothetical protein
LPEPFRPQRGASVVQEDLARNRSIILGFQHDRSTTPRRVEDTRPVI